MIEIRKITNQEGINFLRSVPAHLRKSIFIRDYQNWYGGFIDGQLVSCIAASDNGKYVKLGAQFTLPQYRGIITIMLMEALLNDYEGKYIHAYATPLSAAIDEKIFGFKRGRVFCNGTTFMKRDGG